MTCNPATTTEFALIMLAVCAALAMGVVLGPR